MSNGTFGYWSDASVSLPTESDEYIVHIEGAASTTTLWWNDKHKYFFSEDGDIYIIYSNVTHWMPMPPAPLVRSHRRSFFDLWKDEARVLSNSDFNLV